MDGHRDGCLFYIPESYRQLPRRLVFQNFGFPYQRSWEIGGMLDISLNLKLASVLPHLLLRRFA